MGISQADLAAEMSARLGREVRPLTVTRLEGGKRPIAVDELVAASDALGVEPSMLLQLDGKMPIEAVGIISAGRELSRATNALMDGVRAWTEARCRLRERIEGQSAALKALPGFTQLWVCGLSEYTLEQVVAEAKGIGDGSET